MSALQKIIFACLLASLPLATLQADDWQWDEFPVTFEHVYGKTTVTKKPKRIVSLSYGRHDNLLALGVKPVAVRYWYGDYEYATWPWAKEALGDHKPMVIERKLSIEAVAKANPDLILALWSGLKPEEYELLSQIAPVIAHEKQYSAYGTPWDVQVLTVGKAVGKYPEAQQAVDDINQRMAQIAKAHPNWQGKTTAVAYYWKDKPGAYRSNDIRPQFLEKLGFVTPKAIDNLGTDEDFAVKFSQEDLASYLETDVLFWIVSGNALQQVKGLHLRKELKAHQQGREVFVNELVTGAFSHASLLSIPYTLDTLVPLIEKAIDGNPNTVVSSTLEAGLLD